MKPSLEKLGKFFRLEHELGYADKAVQGGLARILSHWEGEARADGISEEIIGNVREVLHPYGQIAPEARSAKLKSLWAELRTKYPELVASTTRPPAKRTTSPTPSRVPARAQPHTQGGRVAVPREREAVSASIVGAYHSRTPAAMDARLTVLDKVGPVRAGKLAALGLHTLGDMLYYYPRRYDDYRQLKPIKNVFYGEQVTIIGAIQSVQSRDVRRGALNMIEAILSDGTESMRLVWWNQPWLSKKLRVDQQIVVSGMVKQAGGMLEMEKFDWEPIDTEHLNTNRIVPIYPLTSGIQQKELRRWMHDVISFWAPAVVDAVPEAIRQSAGLLPLGEALLHVHFPATQEELDAARHRLAFDEIFFLQIGAMRQKKDWQRAEARHFAVADDWLHDRTSRLPFQLTNAQTLALAGIRKDLDCGRPMNRLLQGDVGSGKTVVAALAAAMITEHGAQAAIMAPTSILAEQHHRTFISLLTGEGGVLKPEQVRLLVGETRAREKEKIRAGLESGEIAVIIGTHAVIEPDVKFRDLQLAVIDEQHRFGVEQRAELRTKGTNPHLLVMTATPIPRSLALTVYGDLDISIIGEMPVGRQPIETQLLRPHERDRAYSIIREQVKQGRQAFIVYPLIDESEKMEDLKAATDEYERLGRDVFPDLKLGLLHGRLKGKEKDKVMEAFRAQKYDALVSTTVIEVGVDVPNATVMLIEGAERFGLAQLHQLRGRVGRGAARSTCLLIPSHDDAAENTRLHAMVESNDGFVLAERDLETRGPGDFLGSRQSGFAFGLRMASLSDLPLIEKARMQAKDVLDADPELSQSVNSLLAESLQRVWGRSSADVS